MIARTLTSHRGQQAWVMRRRTQAELDELVRAAGFSKIEQWVDDWGMFTLSLIHIYKNRGQTTVSGPRFCSRVCVK